MTATTAKLALPYPGGLDAPAGPAQIQALAEAMDSYGPIGGKRRVNTSSNITTVESIVIDTQNLSLAANSAFFIEYDLFFNVSVAATDLNMTLRLTSVSGTIIAGPVATPGPYATQPNQGRLTVVYKTIAAELQYIAGSVVRLAGTGNITAIAPTSLIVTRLAPSSLIGDF